MRFLYFFLLSLKEFLRQPMYVLSSLLFPAMFFWFFGVPNAKDSAGAMLLMGSFAGFGVLGVVLFQLAVQTSQEQCSPWLTYVKTLPMGTAQFVLAKVGASFVLSLFAAGAVVLVALQQTPINTQGFRWFLFIISLLLGGVPFALLGLMIGFLVKGKAVLPVANLLYLPLSFAGGLWLPPSALPKVIQNISEYLPTRMYGEIIWAVMFNKEMSSASVKGLGLYSLIFMVGFVWVVSGGRLQWQSLLIPESLRFRKRSPLRD